LIGRNAHFGHDLEQSLVDRLDVALDRSLRVGVGRKGRVWSGEQAKGLGLVDELGDTERAIDVAKQLAHIPANESVEIVRLPKPQSLFDFLLARAQGDVRTSQGAYSSAQSLVQRLSAMVRSEPVRAQMPFTLTIH
jgi:protease-4